MCLSRIARTYNGGVGVATSPPPHLFYHSGRMNLRERPRVKGTSKKIGFSIGYIFLRGGMASLIEV